MVPAPSCPVSCPRESFILQPICGCALVTMTQDSAGAVWPWGSIMRWQAHLLVATGRAPHTSRRPLTASLIAISAPTLRPSRSPNRERMLRQRTHFGALRAVAVTPPRSSPQAQLPDPARLPVPLQQSLVSDEGLIATLALGAARSKQAHWRRAVASAHLSYSQTHSACGMGLATCRLASPRANNNLARTRSPTPILSISLSGRPHSSFRYESGAPRPWRRSCAPTPRRPPRRWRS